jgi:hypothetical protein
MRKNTNMADMFRQVGALILKGAKPPDLPTAQGRHRGAAGIDFRMADVIGDQVIEFGGEAAAHGDPTFGFKSKVFRKPLIEA